ncbi:MAG: glycosyltransferase family 4 protein, partial [Deltaproteobacteria bacterium]|nr:glycosyltransferase family 4 protein [Deltaproteobacteria bacterium]
MNVFIPVYFNAPLGGLQSHVRAQCKAVIESGSSATVMCKPGVFSEILKADGVTVLTNDFKDVVDAADQALSAGSYDIVHAHPFESRIVGTIVSLRQNIPLFVTFHHMYFDHVSSWFQHSSLIITVTHSIRDLIVKEYDIEKSKIIIIPNTIRIESNANEQQIQDHQASQKKLIVTVSSRLDDDKIILVNNLVKALQECIEHNNYQIKWQICGDGKYFEKIKNLGDVLNNASGENIFEMPGWLEMNELQKYYRNADICIGPGRSALDAMTCGKPVIAVGNKGYIGLIRPENIMEGIYSNFGEYISLNSENHLLLYEELISCIQNRNELYDAGIRSSEFIRQYFNENKESSNLLSLYKYFSSNYRDSRLKKFKDITSADWVFSGKTKPVVMGKWHLTKDIEADIT